MKKPELLAPAGAQSQLIAAVRFGADAVYVGGQRFGLRAYAGNFDDEALCRATDYVHAHGRRIHVTLNAFLYNDDLDGLADAARALERMGADAAIVADPAAVEICREVAPRLPLHLSTQANTLNWRTAAFWHRNGIRRVILARELNLEDVRGIRRNTPEDLEIEAFVHGAMCVSYSGRCLLSNYMTGRDSSRGACAQPCRYQYALVEEKRPGEYFPVFEDEQGTYILNSRDMCMIDHVAELLEAGLDSLKIEGRAKSAYYAAMVTAAYRHAIDAAADGRPLDPVWRAEVDKVSHRHYSTGFYYGYPGQYTDSARYIRDWQVLAVVTECDGEGNAALSLRNKFAAGDEIEVVGPDVAAFAMTAPMMTDGEGQALAEPRHPQMTFYMKLPRPVPPLSVVRACRKSS